MLPLACKAFDTMVLPVQNAGKIVSEEELMAEVWQNGFVESFLFFLLSGGQMRTTDQKKQCELR